LPSSTSMHWANLAVLLGVCSVVKNWPLVKNMLLDGDMVVFKILSSRLLQDGNGGIGRLEGYAHIQWVVASEQKQKQKQGYREVKRKEMANGKWQINSKRKSGRGWMYIYV
jgi:hypothetical protein